MTPWGRRGARALRLALPVLERPQVGVPTHQRFLLALLAGDVERALAEGDALLARASWFMAGFWLSSAAPVRATPTFTDRMRRHGFEAYWTAHGAPDWRAHRAS